MRLAYTTFLISTLLLRACDLLPAQTSSAVPAEVQKNELATDSSWYTRGYIRIKQAVHALFTPQSREEQEEKSKHAYRTALLQRKPCIFQALFDFTLFPKELISMILSYEPIFFIPLPMNAVPAPTSALTSFKYLDQHNKIQEVLVSGDQKGRIALQNIHHPETPAQYFTTNNGGPIGTFAVHPKQNTTDAPLLISASTLYGYKVGNIKIDDQRLTILSTTERLTERDENVHMWDIATGKCINTLCPHKSRAVDDEDERWKVVRDLQKRAKVRKSDITLFLRKWNLATNAHTGDSPEFIPLPCTESSQTSYGKLSEALSTILLPSGAITVVNEQTSKTYQLYGHTAQVFWAQLRGDYLVTASQDRTIKVWNLSEERCLCTLHDHAFPIRSLWLTDDGKLFSGDDAGVITMHKLKEFDSTQELAINRDYAQPNCDTSLHVDHHHLTTNQS